MACPPWKAHLAIVAVVRAATTRQAVRGLVQLFGSFTENLLAKVGGKWLAEIFSNGNWFSGL
jgi:hypothetical protein